MRILPAFLPAFLLGFSSSPLASRQARHSRRGLSLVAACGLGVAVCLSGCAYKNPLIDGSVAKAEPKAEAPAAPAKPVSADSTVQQAAPTGLKRVFWVFSPYRVDIQQGNFISQEMVAQLKEGMTREQVRFVLGTPLLADIFHADRWDYSFRLQKGNGEITASRVAVFFKEGRMTRFEGGSLPTEQDYIARIAGPTVGAKK